MYRTSQLDHHQLPAALMAACLPAPSNMFRVWLWVVAPNLVDHLPPSFLSKLAAPSNMFLVDWWGEARMGWGAEEGVWRGNS